MRKAKRHDHRRSMWVIAGGTHFWCYQCGAWAIDPKYTGEYKLKWHKPTGIGGPNPAVTDRETARDT